MDFKSLFTKPSRGADLEKLLNYQLQWLLLLRIILYTSILGISFFFNSGKFKIIILPDRIAVLFLLTVYITTISSAYFLTTRQDKLKLLYFSIFQYLLDTIFASVLVFLTGASQSIFSSVYFFPIIASSLLLPKKGGLSSAAAATLLYGTTLFLENQGVYPSFFDYYNFIPDQDYITGLNRFAVMGLTFFLAALLSGLFVGRLKSTEDALSDTMDSYDELTLRYKDIFDHIATGIVTINRDEMITSANNAATIITGFSMAELIGSKFSTYLPNFNLNATNARLTIDYARQDGIKIKLGYSTTILPHPTAKPNKDDNSFLLTDDHKIITIQDISEIERLEKKIRHAEKLAAIGRMSASIAHDFRNPLTAISGSAQLLAKEFSATMTTNSSTDLELVNIIIRESTRLNNTISDFLRFARPENVIHTWFSLSTCLNEVVQVCEASNSWPSSCVINRDLDETIYLWADQGQIFTLLTQIIQNGVSMCKEGEEIINIEAEEVRKGNNDEVIIRISDNGVGIEESTQEKLFEPFYTTRPDGTGLGLTIVRQIIEEHKGQISIQDSSMGGAMFTLQFPLPAAQ